MAFIGPGSVRLWTAQGSPGEAGGEQSRRPRCVVVFAGKLQTAIHLPGELARAGFDVDVVDAHPMVGGRRHNMRDDELTRALLAAVSNGVYAMVWVATPCRAYSVRRGVKLYSRAGELDVPPNWRAFKRRADELAVFSARVIDAAHAAGVAWAIENPADRGEEGSVAYWEKYADHCPLWLQPCIRDSLAAAGAVRFIFAMCAFGAAWQKYTCVQASRSLADALAFLRCRGCAHGTAAHETVIEGYDEAGESVADKSGAYPARMCTEVAQAVAAALLVNPRRVVPQGVSAGLELDATISARVEELRRAPRPPPTRPPRENPRAMGERQRAPLKVPRMWTLIND